MTARHSAMNAARVRERLSPRDLEVLSSLYLLRLLKGEQVQRLHVAEGSETTRARRTRALLKRLFELKLIVRFSRVVGGVRAGSSGFIYGLSGLGLAVLEVAGPYGARRRTVWETKPAFQDHVLAVAQVYVELIEADREGRTDLLAFQGEPAAWRSFPAVGGSTLTVKPDAYVELGIGEYEYNAFIELDMGTERAPTILRKAQMFVAYWQSGLEQRLTGVFPLVLWLVPDEHRHARLSEIMSRLAAETEQLFAIALHHEVLPALTARAEGSI